jgi:anti-sigma B factor antagonist
MLTIEKVNIEPDVTVLKIIGKIALGRDSQQLEWAVDELINAGVKKLVLDLSAAEYIDSTGVGIIALCSGKLNQAGGALRLSGAKGIVQQVFKVVKMDNIARTFASVEDAAASLGSGAASA